MWDSIREKDCKKTYLKLVNKSVIYLEEPVNLEEPIRLPSPPRIDFSVSPSVHPSIRPSLHLSVCLEYEKMQILTIGIESRVFKWSYLTIIRTLPIPIPMSEKKQIQKRKFVENYSLFTCITNLVCALQPWIMDGQKKPF